jgi:hypothetical protein
MARNSLTATRVRWRRLRQRMIERMKQNRGSPAARFKIMYGLVWIVLLLLVGKFSHRIWHPRPLSLDFLLTCSLGSAVSIQFCAASSSRRSERTSAYNWNRSTEVCILNVFSHFNGNLMQGFRVPFARASTW